MCAVCFGIQVCSFVNPFVIPTPQLKQIVELIIIIVSNINKQIIAVL
jgi:hypothetical protein